ARGDEAAVGEHAHRDDVPVGLLLPEQPLPDGVAVTGCGEGADDLLRRQDDDDVRAGRRHRREVDVGGPVVERDDDELRVVVGDIGGGRCGEGARREGGGGERRDGGTAAGSVSHTVLTAWWIGYGTPAQPLRPVCASPWMNWRWAKMKTTSTGTTVRVVAASWTFQIGPP